MNQNTFIKYGIGYGGLTAMGFVLYYLSGFGVVLLYAFVAFFIIVSIGDDRDY